MAGQWIEARDALEILRDPYVICERLFAGLIESRARLITTETERAENVMVPRELWWARGHAALEQNWDAGDFSTWLEKRTHLSAFGVQLEISGVLAAAPTERRGELAARFSVAGNGDWVSADRLISMIAPTALRPARSVEVRIIEAARLGFVGARAVEAQAAKHGFNNWDWREREWDVPAWFWEQYSGSESSSRSFEQDTARGRGRGPHGPYMQLNGLHFLRADLERYFNIPSVLGKTAIGIEDSDNLSDGGDLTKPRLPESKLAAWWESKSLVREGLSQEELLLLIRASFPDNHVGRDRIRELAGGRKRGPKPIGG